MRLIIAVAITLAFSPSRADEAGPPKPPEKFNMELTLQDRTNWLGIMGAMDQCASNASMLSDVNQCRNLRTWLVQFAQRVQQAKPIE